MCLRTILIVLTLLFTATVDAQIYRWDNGQVIPGTEGIKPVPGLNLSLSHLIDGLSHADFSGGLDLSRGVFSSNNLDHARFDGANLSGADFQYSTLRHVSFVNANLTKVDLRECNFTNADLSGALVNYVSFRNATGNRGFTEQQLASTANFKARDLQDLGLEQNDLSGWNLSGQNLRGAKLSQSSFFDTDLSGAIVEGAFFDNVTQHGFKFSQLQSTASYQNENLRGIVLISNDLTNWDFQGQDLTAAAFDGSILTHVDFTDAIVRGANFSNTTHVGFTQAQLASTASYQAKDLRGIVLGSNDLRNWDFGRHDLNAVVFNSSILNGANFSGSNLSAAQLVSTSLTDAVFAGAVIDRVNFGANATAQGFRKEQLYSTLSYDMHDLNGIQLPDSDLRACKTISYRHRSCSKGLLYGMLWECRMQS